MIVIVKKRLIQRQRWLTLIGLVSMTLMDAYVTPTNNIDYSCLIKAIELVLTNHMGSISHHITPLVINSLGDGHTHARIQTFADRSNSKKPGAHWPHTHLV